MELTYKIWGGAGVLVLAIAWQPAVSAKSVAEIGQIAKSVTVLIQGSDTGSGVLIRQDGSTYTILTARHVIDAPGSYEAVTVTGKRYPLHAQTVQKLPGLDLALLKFNSPEKYDIAALGNSSTLQEGLPVYVTGFPGQGSTINALTYNFTEGQLTALSSKPQTGGYSLVYTNKTLPGMSGGPVFDREARLVGIHGAADGQTQTLEKLNARVFMKTGFNLGIPINSFLAAVGSKAPPGQTVAFATPQGPENSGRSPLNLQSSPNKSPSPSISAGAPLAIATVDAPNPGSSDAFLDAMNQYLQGDLPSALRSSTRALQLNPRFAAAYSLRGSVRYLTQDYSGAVADFSQAIQLDARLGSAYLGRGLSQSALGNPEGAIADYTQAIQLSPDSLSYYNRGVVQLNQGNRQAALADLQKSADIALSNNNQPDYDQAMEALKIAGRNCQQSINKICDR
ncbi:tetratricopeptide repeat-containing serine protease family protein [Altericista sp. CCNU0014]|uniref:tetratricopeptide repeat-containing S1 family peptidase n=1 Tax=Altericista sp. CCNU0014 TaxID=3082949 RepID=UPI00384C80CD